MINTWADYKEYVRLDLIRYGITHWRWFDGIRHPTAGFVRSMRKIEYLMNCRKGRFWYAILQLHKVAFRFRSIFLGFSIPPNTCGPGLAINHWGTIVISPEARIGRNARINVCVNIGIKNGAAPIIGDNVYIGPGAVMFGGIVIGSNVSIGANAVVTHSFPDGVTLVGVPARVIKDSFGV